MKYELVPLLFQQTAPHLSDVGGAVLVSEPQDDQTALDVQPANYRCLATRIATTRESRGNSMDRRGIIRAAGPKLIGSSLIAGRANNEGSSNLCT